MSEVRRWAHTVKWEGLQISAAYMAIDHGGEYVMHTDYAALEAECERLRVKLMTIAHAEPARHGIEWAKAIAAEGNSEPYAKWREAIEERDALAAELAAIKERHAIARRVVDRIGQLCTTPHESKERFIRRVQSVIEWEAQAINGAKPLSAEALQ